MSAWSTTAIVMVGYGGVVRLLRRAARLRWAGGRSADDASGHTAARRADALARRVADGARRGPARRRREAAVPAHAEAIARELRAGCALPEAIALATSTTGPQRSPTLDVLIGLGSEVGGQLAGAFESVAAALRDDLELRDEVHALTAQSRASAILLTALPFAAIGFLGVLQPSTVAFLAGTAAGRACVGAAALLLGGGWSWMASMVRSV